MSDSYDETMRLLGVKESRINNPNDINKIPNEHNTNSLQDIILKLQDAAAINSRCILTSTEVKTLIKTLV